MTPATTKPPIEADAFGSYLQQAQADLTALSFAPAIDKSADVLAAGTAGFFDAESGPDGQPWEEYHWFNPDAGPAVHPTLDVTGRLKNSFTRGGAGHVEQIGERELVFGSSVPYAGVHQDGATITLGVPLVGVHGGYLPAGTTIHIAARPMAGFTEESLLACGNLIADHGLGVF